MHPRLGWVRRLQGLAIEAEGPEAEVGELCHIAARTGGSGVMAEVVGLRAGHVTLMPFGSLEGIAAGAEVHALGQRSTIAAGNALLGRVIDAFGQPLDGHPLPALPEHCPLRYPAPSPLARPRITRVLESGIRAIDALLTLGQGQRVGIFAGSGVGKSTLLGMIARHVWADVNVVALVGERGREVREFIDKQLGAAGLARSVVVVATADQPALARVRAAHAAVALAGWFAQRGQQVVLTLDSMTRLAMARREIGLAAGEPATARGYTPSVFAELPQLCERCGTHPSGGSVTALFTVLVEGDDFNEPVSDCMRAILDGHVVLTRELAQQGLYPAIDLLRSVSRLFPDLADAAERALAASAVQRLALLERHRQMVEIGAYQRGGNPALDEALEREPGLRAWQQQAEGGVPRAEALSGLRAALAGKGKP
ncbi:FliI/YscN family ATPase [Ramlibacter sp. G-1-2-2]|uniref:FliI/YscN family ATPase n=1 Tax=Ramlibacter agri TaxID=2728837 RepID=A0A848GW99_9BURK|nr:FliI/YscN family ATPase [Ramlibacter agri]